MRISWGNKRSMIVFMLVVMVAGAIISCNHDTAYNPTSVNPTLDTTVGGEVYGNFYAQASGSCQLGVTPGNEFFTVTVPAGEYKLTYTTWAGTFNIALKATDCATLTIGIQPCDEVKEVSIQSGSVENIGCPVWESGPVTLYSWPCGGTAECSLVFTSDGTAAVTLFSGGGSATNPMLTCGRSPTACVGNDCGGSGSSSSGAGSAPMYSSCNQFVEQGGDTPETHIVDMGQSSGTFQFEYETYTIRDQIIVTYEGNVLLDTGCVGEHALRSLSYSGSSTTITVQVNPDCAGTVGTLWNFTVSCPQ